MLSDVNASDDELLKATQAGSIALALVNHYLPCLCYESLTLFRSLSFPLKQVLDLIHRYGGSGVRAGDLFGNKSMLAKASRFVSAGVQGVENIYTQVGSTIFFFNSFLFVCSVTKACWRRRLDSSAQMCRVWKTSTHR
jgi:hypothetical protein